MAQPVTIDQFSIENIEKVYTTLKGYVAFNSLYYLVVTIATALMLQKILRIYKEAYKDGVRPDIKHFFELIYQYLFCFTLISVLPFIVSGLEELLSSLQTELVKTVGGDDFKVLEQFKALLKEKMDYYRENPALLLLGQAGPGALLDIIFSLLISPLFYVANTWIYGVFLCQRYMYLLMLEIISPIAIVLALDKETRPHFYTWVKHMIICYLMVPFFLLANFFADSMTHMMIDGDIVIWWALMTSFFLKLGLFAFVRHKLNDIL